ncbi:hypothetical protein Q361_11710 [Flavobacterium croceum DSM 17960]|uniref:Uncharacterized protein n=1 Tax=Flavobacterium croceum DSM 17960 TaxID=1121886 RepID=A0A2S4N5A5_9FLAO|nr:hypothetical protein [Flavobacterium croceum]POS00907.1 hypothetical protein Q361_11710 [Flavobacterium croceum DSM 17960]
MFIPFKKVITPAAVKGIRGDYLMFFMMNIAGGLLVIFLAVVIPINTFLRLLIALGVIVYLLHKYNSFRKLSKGDIYKETKKNARKNIYIKS